MKYKFENYLFNTSHNYADDYESVHRLHCLFIYGDQTFTTYNIAIIYTCD